MKELKTPDYFLEHNPRIEKSEDNFNNRKSFWTIFKNDLWNSGYWASMGYISGFGTGIVVGVILMIVLKHLLR